MIQSLVKYMDWIIVAFCLTLVWPKTAWGEPIFVWVEGKLSGLAQKKTLAVVTTGALAVLARLALLPWLFVPQPKVHDEFSYLLAGETFAHGRLANPPHPLWIFFDTFHVIQHPSYASMYPPGQGIALAIGKVSGQPWIGVLLSVAAMCMAFTWMLQAWVPPQWAFLGGVLVWARFCVFSYWINSYWGGAVAATGASLVLGALARIWDHRRLRDAIVLGIGASILAVSRPLEGAIFMFPPATALLWWAIRMDPPARAAAVKRILLPVAAIVLCAVGFVGFYNSRVTGSPTVFPHMIEQKLITTAIFLWQHDKPPISYANPQFEDFYHNFLPSLYQASWPAAIGQWWYKAQDFWEFFLGPALTIPFLALPWILKKSRNLLLLAQLALSAFGLWIIVYYHAHYAAPLMATLFVILMQCMAVLRRLRLFGRPMGVGLTRIIVLFSVLIGPIYFLQTLVAQPNVLFEWLHRHPVLPLLIALVGLSVLRLASLLSGRPANCQWRLLGSAFEFLLIICITLQLCEMQRNLYADAFPFVDDVNEPFRKPVEKQLGAIPGEHLVLVRYSKNHNSGEEYVYNEADIDHAKIVWAREIPGVDLKPLLTYFRNRDVWLFEPDEDDSVVRPYAEASGEAK